MTVSPGHPVRRLLLVLLGCAVVGVLAGVLWELLWTAPTGLVYEDVWQLDGQGVQSDVTGTGLYVIIGFCAGLLIGVVSALTARTQEVATLATVAVGSVVAAALMAITGHALGPPDPRPLAAGRENFTELDADLRVEGTSPYVALPAGALTGLTLCFVGLAGSSRTRPATEPDG